jgi:hypothetical protein
MPAAVWRIEAGAEHQLVADDLGVGRSLLVTGRK